MLSSPRQLVLACSLAFVSLALVGSAYGQFSRGQQVSQPAWSTSSPNIPDHVSGGIIDHSSMSPDSWSAPAATGFPHSPSVIVSSGPAVQLQPHSGNGIAPPLSPAIGPKQIVGPQSSNQFDPNSNKPTPPIARVAKGFPAFKSSSPSIPNLQIESTNQINSLIRQPETPKPRSVLNGSFTPTAKSPFQSAKYSKGSQTQLPLTSSSPAAKSKLQSPAFGSIVTEGATPQATSGRYPLGINNGLSNYPQTSHPPLSDQSPTITGELTTEPFVTQPRNPSYSSQAFSEPAFEQQLPTSPTFRPDLGHRDQNPTFRGRTHDSGLKMDFEDKKKQFPTLGETLATGRYFGSITTLFLQPGFQQNSVITQFNSSPATATFASSESFDFDYETAPRLRFGFESNRGPGVELDYWQFDEGSNVSAFTSTGLNSGELSAGLFGPSSLTTLSAVNAGETLSAIHAIDIETFSIMFFKEVKLPIARFNGSFGFQYASVFQSLDAELTDAGGDVLGSIRSTSDFRAYGPKFRFEYYRPIGHTRLEFVTTLGGGALFGERDQIVTNSELPAVNRFGADEFVLTTDFYSGIQWSQETAENRNYFLRLGVVHQSWIGGGTAVSAEDNFGLRGFAFEVGFNR